MKYLTLTVPCYNSEDYMERCIDSLVTGGDDVEVIIVDDGSTDQTAAIADSYQDRYPGIVKVVHKENGGHGSGVNKGLELATGKYFKVVDSDDWFDQEAYQALLHKIREFTDNAEYLNRKSMPDLFLCNFVYDHLDAGYQHPVNYRNVFRPGQICGWNDIRHFRPNQYLIMHAMTYRTEIVRKSGVVLPEHMFYVDNIFAYQPLPFIQTIYYLDVDLYHYYLGRDDQSVNPKMLMKRIDQQLYVTNLVARLVDLDEIERIYPKLATYMLRNISIMISISTIHLLLISTDESYQKRKDMWTGIREYDENLFYKLRRRTLSGLTVVPGRWGGKIVVTGYKIANKIYDFQ